MESSPLAVRNGERRAVEADPLADAFYPLFGRLFDSEGALVVATERKLAEARMPQPVEVFLSRALGVGVLTGLALWVVGLAVGYALVAAGLPAVEIPLVPVPVPAVLREAVVALKVPAIVFATGLAFGSAGFAAGFGAFVARPHLRASAREREINLLLADSVSFMYALSMGGLNRLEIIEAMARTDDTYGEVAREFQSIVQQTEYFEDDYRTAIRKQVDATPSDEFAQLLTDMLAIINSGGDMTQFLEDKKHKHMRTAKQQQERVLDTLELFGEMYITLSLFPLLLLIVVVVMSLLGEASRHLLYVTVYGLIPLLGVAFLVLVSTVKQDDPGSGILREEHDEGDWHGYEERTRSGPFHLGLVEAFTGTYGVFDKIRNRELANAVAGFLRTPHYFFRDNPTVTLAVTVPASMLFVGAAVATGAAPTTVEGLTARPVWGTFLLVYVPAYVCGIPLAVFWEWNVRTRRSILGDLSDTLRKLAGVNDTGMTLLQSVGTVAETSSGRLAEELREIYVKVNYGMSVSEAFVDFNNEYRIPRLARTVKLIVKAQAASNQIRTVLSTAAKASENQDDIDRERRSRTRMQVVIILMTFFTLLTVMVILKSQFLGAIATMATGPGGAGGAGAGADAGGFGLNLDVGRVSMLFFHAVTLQAILSGVISGYMQDAKVLSGVKYVVVLLTVALAVWTLVG